MKWRDNFMCINCGKNVEKLPHLWVGRSVSLDKQYRIRQYSCKEHYIPNCENHIPYEEVINSITEDKIFVNWDNIADIDLSDYGYEYCEKCDKYKIEEN